MITIQSGKMIIPEEERFVGFAGDNQSSTKQFLIKGTPITDVDAVFSLYLRFDDDRVTSAPLSAHTVDSDTVLTWNVRAEHLLKSGIVLAQLKITGGDGSATHYSRDYFIVGESAERGDDGGEIDVLCRSEFEERMQQTVREARAIAPYIGTDGYWYVYSAAQGDYVRSICAHDDSASDRLSALEAKFPVQTADIADNAVTRDKMASGSVGYSEIIDASVSASKLSAGAVTEAKIADGAVTTGKISDGAVTGAKIASGVIPDVSDKENASNKVTSLSAQSTDAQYPSAKCVYDLVGNIESAFAAML